MVSRTTVQSEVHSMYALTYLLLLLSLVVMVTVI